MLNTKQDESEEKKEHALLWGAGGGGGGGGGGGETQGAEDRNIQRGPRYNAILRGGSIKLLELRLKKKLTWQG